VIFVTLEDETGVANLVVWPKVFERFRRVVLGAQLMVVRGPLQKEGLVIHVIAEGLIDRSDLLRRLAETEGGRSASRPGPAAASAPFQVPLAHADHVKSSGPPDPRDPGTRRREQTLLEPLRARQVALAAPLARADEVKRPGRDLRQAAPKVTGFKSRDFH
jgi:error-prone DNA polymerase